MLQISAQNKELERSVISIYSIWLKQQKMVEAVFTPRQDKLNLTIP